MSEAEREVLAAAIRYTDLMVEYSRVQALEPQPTNIGGPTDWEVRQAWEDLVTKRAHLRREAALMRSRSAAGGLDR